MGFLVGSSKAEILPVLLQNLSSFIDTKYYLSVLFLDELIVGDVRGQEGLWLGGVGIFCDLGECGSELILAVLAGNVPTVSRDLSSIIYRHFVTLLNKYNCL